MHQRKRPAGYINQEQSNQPLAGIKREPFHVGPIDQKQRPVKKLGELFRQIGKLWE
jgi:hypothetical protein